MSNSTIPEAIYNFNIYDETSYRLLCTGPEISMPDLQNKTVTVSGGGILGEIDSPLIGQYADIEFEIPYRMLGEESFQFMKKQTKGTSIIIRGAMQVTNPKTHEIQFKKIRVIIRGRNKGNNLGKMKQGESMDGGLKIGVTYLKVEIEGANMFELDKFNDTLVVDGEDQLKEIRGMC